MNQHGKWTGLPVRQISRSEVMQLLLTEEIQVWSALEATNAWQRHDLRMITLVRISIAPLKSKLLVRCSVSYRFKGRV